MLTFKGALHPRRRHSPHQIQRREELWIRHLQSRGERASGVEEEQAAVMPNKKRVSLARGFVICIKLESIPTRHPAQRALFKL